LVTSYSVSVLDLHDADYFAATESVEARCRVVAWVLLGFVLVMVGLFLYFVGFAPDANAAGGCGGG
jgi:hypothetical protein